MPMPGVAGVGLRAPRSTSLSSTSLRKPSTVMPCATALSASALSWWARPMAWISVTRSRAARWALDSMTRMSGVLVAGAAVVVSLTGISFG